MDDHAKLEALIDLAESLGIAMRSAAALDGSEAGGAGALVKLKGKEILFLNPQASTADQIDLLARVLKGRVEIEDKFLPPQIRQIIETAQPDE